MRYNENSAGKFRKRAQLRFFSSKFSKFMKFVTLKLPQGYPSGSLSCI